MENTRIPDKWLIMPIILLFLNFIYRLVDKSKLIVSFPLDYTNDLSSYMAQLFFLAKCGFHKLCPYWYNGFTTFQSTPPLWFFLTEPLYWLTNSITLSTYLSIILLFIAIFITIYYFGKLNHFSNIKIIAFFLFLLANAITVGNFIRLGRPHELLAGLFFIIISFMCLWYKNKDLTKNFYLIIIPLILVILSHQTMTILSFIILFSLFISKREFKDKLKIILSAFVSIILTSFWWIPFLKNFSQSDSPNRILGQSLISFNIAWLWQNLATLIIPIIFLILFYFYYQQRKSKKEIIFFSPIILIALLLLFRIIAFIPLLQHVYPDSYLFMFIFFSIYFLFKLDIRMIPFNKLIPLALILVVIISISFNMFYTPFFIEHSQLEEDTLEVLEKVSGNFLILNSPSTNSYESAYYSYAPIYLNITSPSGFYPHVVSADYISNLSKIKEITSCSKLNRELNYFNTTDIITYNEHCLFFKKCGLKQTYKKNNVCLFKK